MNTKPADDIREHQRVLCNQLQESMRKFTIETGVLISGIGFDVQAYRDASGEIKEVLYWDVRINIYLQD
jgi:hypothetical protein